MHPNHDQFAELDAHNSNFRSFKPGNALLTPQIAKNPGDRQAPIRPWHSETGSQLIPSSSCESAENLNSPIMAPMDASWWMLPELWLPARSAKIVQYIPVKLRLNPDNPLKGYLRSGMFQAIDRRQQQFDMSARCTRQVGQLRGSRGKFASRASRDESPSPFSALLMPSAVGQSGCMLITSTRKSVNFSCRGGNARL